MWIGATAGDRLCTGVAVAAPPHAASVMTAMAHFPGARRMAQFYQTGAGGQHQRSTSHANASITACHRRAGYNGVMAKLEAFLCHSSGDKIAVRRLYQGLASEPFVQPWIDEENLLPGQDWELEIRGAVRESHVVIVCLSKESVTREGFSQKEIKMALDVADEKPQGTIFIIPVKLEECDVPERLRNLHSVNLFEDAGYEKLLRALRARLCHTI